MTRAPLLPIDMDVAQASTLEARAYTDPDIFALEHARIWARTWQPVGRVANLAHPGDFMTCEVAGEPIVVVRGTDADPDRSLRAFYNVCRHRAGPVAVGNGNRKSLTCRYHGWTYALDGKLLATPELDGIASFDRSCHGLREVAVEAWGPFVFVHLDPPSKSLASLLAPIMTEIAPFDIAAMKLVERRDYSVACNWKVYVDNYLEGYHLPLVHPGLHRELDWARYRVETFDGYSRQHAPMRATPGDRLYDASGEALYYFVFPSWMINIYPDNLSLNIVVPLAVDRTLTIFEWYVRNPDDQPPDALDRTLSFSDQVQQEDIVICEAVQKGLSSRSYDRGRYAPARENGVHHFHRTVHRLLTAV